jgi:uncharacterized protein (TIRG00374 family)
MKLSTVLKYTVSAALAGGLLWYVLKGIDLHILWENIKNANYFWVFLSAAMALTAHWSRAYRWKLMLQPLGYNPGIGKSMIAVLIGYLTNLIFPRAGELARSASLQDLEKVPFEKSFGAVVAERLIDVLVLVLLIGLNLALEFDRLSDFFSELIREKVSNPLLILVVLVGLIGFAVVGFILFRKNKHRFQHIGAYQKISKIIEGLWSGFTGIRNLKNTKAFIAHTVLIWTLYYFMTWFLCFALPQTADLNPLAGLTILVMGTIGMAAPTVGGIGSYHFLVGKIVGLYGLNPQDGITLATFLHTMQGIVFVVIFGLGALAASFFIRRKDQLS